MCVEGISRHIYWSLSLENPHIVVRISELFEDAITVVFDAEYEGGGTDNTGGIVDTVVLGVVFVEITVVCHLWEVCGMSFFCGCASFIS